MSSLVERLRAYVIETRGSPSSPFGRHTKKTHRNPDGPEAANEIERLREAVVSRDKTIAAMADAIDVADAIIERQMGTDTPKEWNQAFKRVVKARTSEIALSLHKADRDGG